VAAVQFFGPGCGDSKKTIETKLLEQWEELPPLIITSAEKKSGRDKVLDFISEAMQGDD